MTIKLFLENALGTLAKISTNVLQQDPNLTIFTLPIDGITLVEEQLDQFLGKYTFRSWFEQRKDSAWYPCSWWAHRKDGDFPIDEEFHAEKLTLTLSGDQQLDFVTQKAESKDEDDVPAAKISAIKLRPTPGGITILSLHVQVRPGIGKTNLMLQEHQYRPISITLGETKIAVKKRGAQQQLPLEPAKDEKPAAELEKPPVVFDGSHLVALGVVAVDVGTADRNPDVAIGAELDALVGYTEANPRPEGWTDQQVREHFDQQLSAMVRRPEPFVSKGGDAVDAELRARNPEAAGLTIAERVEGTLFGDIKHRDGDFESVAADVLKIPQAEVDAELASEKAVDDPAVDLARFEEGAREEAAAFKARATTGGVIDGRSERVKHQDRQRATDDEAA